MCNILTPKNQNEPPPNLKHATLVGSFELAKCEALSKIVFAMQNPRNAELRVLARRVAMASRFVNFLIVTRSMEW